MDNVRGDWRLVDNQLTKEVPKILVITKAAVAPSRHDWTC